MSPAVVDKPYLRYTELPPLFSLLRQRELTLLNPDSWDDRNDSAYIRLYREKQKLKSVLALCFTQASETYHHWRVFAPTASGVCIRFREKELKAAVRKVTGLRLRPVEYLTIDELRRAPVSRHRLPFLKRFPFKPEHESRMLWESASEERASLPVPIPLEAISRITLSPWLHPALVDGVKAMIKGIPGCAGLRVYRSTLVGNHDWIEHGRQAT